MVRLRRPLALPRAALTGLAALATATALAGSARAQDGDGDGVIDGLDAFPCDATASGVAFAPAEGSFAMTAFEDMWPAAGDLDFNDLVVSHAFTFRLEGGRVRGIRVQLGVLAVGGDLDNGLGLALPIPRRLVQSVRRTVNGAAETALEPEQDALLTLRVSPNVREFFDGRAGPINSDGPALGAPSVELRIDLAEPVALALGDAPFDLFIFRSGDPAHQIHRPAYGGTATMASHLFGTADDGSDGGRFFVDRGGLPFALTLPRIADWPRERTPIHALYPDVVGFASSGGATHQGFYGSRVVDAHAYGARPAAPAVLRPAIDRACLRLGEYVGTSCQTIWEAAGGAVEDGLQTIDPDGEGGRAPATVWCDMREDGGWEVLVHDTSTSLRGARGTPSGSAGWSMDLVTAGAPLRDQRVQSFAFEVDGGRRRTFDDLRAFGSAARRTVHELFGASRGASWGCNSDAPGDGTCAFTTGDGRHWGVWENTSGCCLGAGGYWFYSAQGGSAENWGICGSGYPFGTGYTASATGCSGGSWYTPHSGVAFRISIKAHVLRRAEGATCRTILDAGLSRGDGAYLLDLDGNPATDPEPTWCDMTTDGGGWIVAMDDTFANLRRPRGTPAAGTGWTTDFLSASAPLANLPLADFAVSLPGAWTQTWRDVVGLGSTRRVTPRELFADAPPPSWACNSDNPGASSCAFTTRSDGRHWGRWTSATGCCIGQATGGFWFYSASGASALNHGVCGDGYTHGEGYTPTTSGCSGAGHFTPTSPTGSRRLRVMFREPARSAPRNTADAARASCREILDRGESTGDGVYWLRRGAAEPYLARCDMTTDGGGWTTFFAGINGAPGVFDRFDAASHQGACLDPSTRCLRRLPADLPANATLAVVHGASAVSVPLAGALRSYLASGQQARWVNVAATALEGAPVRTLPDWVWTGEPGNDGFIFARGQSSGQVFAASYGLNSTWNMGNGIANDVVTPLRLMYREGDRPADPVLNAAADARASCRAILDRGESKGSGLYHVSPDGAAPALAWCDMELDGGGWTTFFAGHNGSPNVIDNLDAGYHSGVCTDPRRRCVRRMPPGVPQAETEVAVVAADAAVALTMTPALHAWATAGTQGGWLSVTSQSIGAGVVPHLPDTLWSGAGSNRSWILTQGSDPARNLAASYNPNSWWDHALSRYDVWTPIRMMYREGGYPRAPDAFTSCRAALAAGNTASGVYLVQPLGGRPRRAWCDMTTDGGGWTALFSGTNGSPNVFDHFDAGYHSGACSDPATRCLARLQPVVPLEGLELAIACGDAMIRAPVTAAIRNWMVNGTQAGWAHMPGAVSIGTATVRNLPDHLWTGSGGNRSFIAARGQASGASTFASSYNLNTTWDQCNGESNTSARLRLFYRERL